jgi:membrane protein YdbS with pleckstrin-like domain
VAYAALALGYVVTMPLVRYRVHRWETTDVAVYTQSGWLSRERRIAPMSRVQTVDVEQGPVARLLGLASVTVTTASAAGPLRIEGLDRATADRLVTDLTRQTQAQPGDAT